VATSDSRVVDPGTDRGKPGDQPDGPPRPSTSELTARAADLAPLLRANAERGEHDRRVPEQSIDALAEAGLFRLAVSRRYGGYETDMRTMLDVAATVAESDGGTGWVISLCNVGAWVIGLFPEAAQDDVFAADPDARVCGVLAPTAEVTRVPGGWRVTGRWYYNSGSLHSSWAVLGVPITDDAGTVVDQGAVLIPMSELTIEDTWFVAGMKSSGSNCVVAEDVFVPIHRFISVPEAIDGTIDLARPDETLYRSAFVPMLSLILVGPLLGLGRAALRHVTEKASGKPVAYTFFDTQAESVAFQLQLTDAALLIDTGHLHAYRAAADIDETAARGAYPDYFVRARIRADTSYVAQKITHAIDVLMFAHGAASFADVNPLQRIWRDAGAGARHAAVVPGVSYEVYGKALLGIDEKITPLV